MDGNAAHPELKQASLLQGLLLPKELCNPWTEHSLEDKDYCQPIRLTHAFSEAQWKGLLFMFPQAMTRIFVETCSSGRLRICYAKEVQILFSHLPQASWQLVYGHTAQTLTLSLTDAFSRFDKDACEIEIPTSDSATTVSCSRDVQKALVSFLPFKNATYLFHAHRCWYLCNIQGSHPTCLVGSFDDTGQPAFAIYDIRLRPRDQSRFRFSDTEAKTMSDAERDVLLGAVAFSALSGWKQVNSELFALETYAFCNGKHRLQNTSVLGQCMLEYVQSSQLPRATRKAISAVQIDLLYSELVYARFHLVVEEFRKRGVPDNVILTFHGLRCDDTEQAVQNIVDFGFSAKHAKHTMYGAGGIYCTQQFGCALQWVKNTVGKGTNYVFVCLALPGNPRSGGKPNEPMQPNQHSWHAMPDDIWPHTYWVIGEQALLPIMLLTLH